MKIPRMNKTSAGRKKPAGIFKLFFMNISTSRAAQGLCLGKTLMFYDP